MNKPDSAVYLSKQIRLCEQDAMQHPDIDADELMLRAGRVAFETMKRLFPDVRHLTVFCGSGNNAGDGYIFARLAQEKGYAVTINQFKPVEGLPEPARHAALKAIAAGVTCRLAEDSIDSDTDLIIDALLGIGLQGEVREPLLTAVNLINESDIPVLSIDIPSGLQSDTGQIMGACVKADLTVTFIGKKLGMVTLNGPDVCGQVLVDSLKLDAYLSAVPVAAQMLHSGMVRQCLPARPRHCHKNQFGHLLIIGGGIGMPGAPSITAQAALRTGAGLVTIAANPHYEQYVLAQIPEAMVYGIDEVVELKPLLDKATVCVIGPGLGEDEWARQLFNLVIARQLPMVIDASALHILADHPQHDDNWILTPHPGEAAALLHCSAGEVQRDRYQAIKEIQRQYGGTIVLKGAGSLVCTDKEDVFICSAGNPGMASPGMGDALSGIIAGLIGQGLSLVEAANIGVYVHARAGDLAVQKDGERGLLATDLLPFVRRLVNHKK